MNYFINYIKTNSKSRSNYLCLTGSRHLLFNPEDKKKDIDNVDINLLWSVIEADFI